MVINIHIKIPAEHAVQTQIKTHLSIVPEALKYSEKKVVDSHICDDLPQISHLKTT
jgi:hypothetical protein